MWDVQAEFALYQVEMSEFSHRGLFIVVTVIYLMMGTDIDLKTISRKGQLLKNNFF